MGGDTLGIGSRNTGYVAAIGMCEVLLAYPVLPGYQSPPELHSSEGSSRPQPWILSKVQVSLISRSTFVPPIPSTCQMACCAYAGCVLRYKGDGKDCGIAQRLCD